MSTTFKPSYSGAASSLTITLASLTSGSYRQSTAVDNSTNLYQDVIITGKIKSGASGVGSTAYATLYAYAYDGTNYSNNASGTDGSYTVDLQGNLMPIATIGVTTNATTYYLQPVQLAAAAGWLFLPQKWGLILYNGTSATLDTTAGNFLLEYQGLNLQGV